MDCDQNESSCGMSKEELLEVLQQSMDQETELLRTYTIVSERVQDNEELRVRLQNFAEGNAKRSRQLQDEIQSLH